MAPGCHRLLHSLHDLGFRIGFVARVLFDGTAIAASLLAIAASLLAIGLLPQIGF